eukprot:6181121-Amphidinium_carterae.1
MEKHKKCEPTGLRSLTGVVVVATALSGLMTAFVAAPAPSLPRAEVIARRAGVGQGADNMVLSQDCCCCLQSIQYPNIN